MMIGINVCKSDPFQFDTVLNLGPLIRFEEKRLRLRIRPKIEKIQAFFSCNYLKILKILI